MCLVHPDPPPLKRKIYTVHCMSLGEEFVVTKKLSHSVSDQLDHRLNHATSSGGDVSQGLMQFHKVSNVIISLHTLSNAEGVSSFGDKSNLV